MADPPKSSGFSQYLKPALMGLVMFIMAGLGAWAASSLRGEKPSENEENPADVHADTQGQPEFAKPADSGHDAVRVIHSTDATVDREPDDRTPPAAGSDESDGFDRNHTAKVVGANPDSSALMGTGYGEGNTAAQFVGADPFSETALGFGVPEPKPQSNSPDHGPRSRRTAEESRLAAREDRMMQQAINLLTSADEQLASGSYVQAMGAYQSLRQESEGSPGVAILFRLALCAEAAGRHAAAIEAYRKVSGTQADPAWAGAARYGEARCLAAVKRHDGLQTDLLRRAVLDETDFLPTVRSEVLHLIGRDLWREQTATNMVDLLDDRRLFVPEWSADPARLLDELPLLLHETPVVVGPVEFQLLHLDDATPDGVSVRLHCGMTQIESLLKNLITGCRIKFDISEQAAALLQGRSQQVRVTDRRLAVLLDAMTLPYDLAWRLQDATVQIIHRDQMSAEELRKSRLDAAERLLRIAVMEGPNSPQIGHSRLALSTLLHEQNRTADAVQFLQVQMESAPRSVVETEAAFNLGKCLMDLNKREEARGAFLRSVDASGGLVDVKIASYIFASRLLLEDHQGKLAISTMMRGLAISEGSELEPWAALQLGSAYLILDNPQGANSVLMERREKLANGPGREGAAFVSALARFRAAVLSDRREREGWAVVSALSEFRPEDYCGGHWAVLAAGACDELGLSQQSTEAFGLALKRLPPCDLRDQTVLRLAAHCQADNQLEQARLLLATLTSSEAVQLVFQARLRSAEVALEQDHPDEAILACRLLIDSHAEPPIHRAALKIMGQAYERQQNHHAAIYCFAGLLPDDETARGTADDVTRTTSSGGQAP